jgi:hypothetical protein
MPPHPSPQEHLDAHASTPHFLALVPQVDLVSTYTHTRTHNAAPLKHCRHVIAPPPLPSASQISELADFTLEPVVPL